jgi:GDP-mannose 6-dehydrogenase
VAGEVGQGIRSKQRPHIVVVRSTVVPGTTQDVVASILKENAGNAPFSVAFNPEFLREGSAVSDFNTPSKTVVGARDEETAAAVMSLYADLPGPKITTDIETAELIKYVDNAWHALKVVFGNEIGLIAKSLGIDSHKVMQIFCEDKRLNISSAYLRPGFAYGGSCLPKDLRALTHLAKSLDLSLPVLSHIQESNRMLIDRGAEWILNEGSRRIGFLGISFKSGTDDVRESSFVDLVERLIGKGREVRIFDPNVRLGHLMGANREYLMRVLPHVTDLLVEDISEVVDWADTIVSTNSDPAYSAGITGAKPGQTVLDFGGVKSAASDAKVAGFLW